MRRTHHIGLAASRACRYRPLTSPLNNPRRFVSIQRHLPRLGQSQILIGTNHDRLNPCRRNSSTQRIPSDVDTLPSDLPDANATLDKSDDMICAYFDSTGRFIDSQQYRRSKAEIAQQFELRHRDLRDLDLRSESVARILIRPKTILLQFFHLCIIIQADEALLISHDHDTTPSSTESKSRRQKIYHDFSLRLQTSTTETPGLPTLPYELRAVEAALDAVLQRLRTELHSTQTTAEKLAQSLDLSSGLAAITLDQVFESTRRLAQIEQKARCVRDTIREVLDADEDLAGMYLTDSASGKPHEISDHQEAEYLLEAYHQATDSLVMSAHATSDLLRKREATFRAALAVQRNQIMFLEARIAIHTLGVAAGTMIAGLFGMNLVNYAEDATYGFAAVTGGSVVLSLLFSSYGMRRMWRIQSLKALQQDGRRGRG